MSPVPFENPPADAEVPAVSASTVPNATDATLSEAWVTLRARKKLIIAMAALGAIYGFYEGATQPRLYDASGTIEIRSGSSNEYRIGTADRGEGSSRLPTEVAILKSDSLLLSVARDRNLANDPAFIGSAGHYQNVDDPAVRNRVVGALQRDISVSVIAKTDLVRISCKTAKAQLSADIVNQLVKDYIAHSFQSRADATKRVESFFSTQLDDLKQQVETSQAQMLELQKKLGVLGFDPKDNQITSTLDELNRAAGAAELARIAAETHYNVLSNMDPSILDQAGNAYAPSNVSTLRRQLDTLRVDLAKLDTTNGPNNPQELAIRNQIAELNKEITVEETRILSESKQVYLAAQAQENQTNSALDSEKATAYKLRDDLLQYTLQEREFEANRTLYDGLEQRLRTAGVEAGLESTEIEPIDTAYAPLGPTLKPRTNILVVDTFVMLVFGVILAFVLESLDTGLRSVAEIESVSGLPSLALIPRARRSVSDETNLSTAMRNLGTLSSPKSQFSEAFRALRTSLLLSVAGGEPKVILLTSATPSEGKTTVSINLACVLAQRNVRVLIIDADLRRPTVHHRFGLNGKVGLTSVLTGSVTLEEAIQNVPEIPQLDVLVSGPVPPFPTEMLSSETMQQLLERCKGIYTHIIMDSPPLLSVTDSVVLARDADAVVMIVRHGKSSKHAMRRARDLLIRSGAPVTGIVLNAVDLNSPEYYAYYGYYGYTGYAAAGVDSAGWESKNDAKDQAARRQGKSGPGKGDIE
ncbi:MAG: polysaccharide biosynthesis tyrosine autokinase [Acidobacteriaceae bacterium]